MTKSPKTLIALMICMFLFFGHTQAWATNSGNKPPAALVMVDIMPMRILGLGATVLGSALFVVTFPFTAFSGPEDALESLVVTPFRYTFIRPLGQFDNWDENDAALFEEPIIIKDKKTTSETITGQEAPDF